MKAMTFNDSPIQLSVEQLKFKEFVLTTKVKITQLWGGPGTGKSTVLKQIISEMADKVMVTACSNAAANELGGLTIHRALGVRPLAMGSINISADSMLDGEPRDMSKHVLIVDEASMINEELYELILASNPKRLILVGDREQIKPVKSKPAVFPTDNIYTFESNHRCKTEKLKTMNKAMRGASHEEIMKSLPASDNSKCPTAHCLGGGTYIAYTNKEVVRVSDALFRVNEPAEVYFKSCHYKPEV